MVSEKECLLQMAEKYLREEETEAERNSQHNHSRR